jgi:hypothetical protein
MSLGFTRGSSALLRLFGILIFIAVVGVIVAAVRAG